LPTFAVNSQRTARLSKLRLPGLRLRAMFEVGLFVIAAPEGYEDDQGFHYSDYDGD
jgi:hypothetical protein